MFVEDSLEYKSVDTFAHGNVLLSTRISGEDAQEDGELLYHDTHISVDLGEPKNPDYLRLSVAFRGIKESSDMHVFGMRLASKSNVCSIPGTRTEDADDPVHSIFHEPLQKMLDVYHAMPKEQRADALSNLKGRMKVVRFPMGYVDRHDVNGANVRRDIASKRSVDLDNVDNFDYLLSEFPGGPENEDKLSDIESGTMRLGLWTQASTLLLGTQIFDKPVQYLMKQMATSGMKWEPQSLSSYFKTVPVGSDRHRKLMNNHWDAIC
jgi:hypothetical protein